MDIKKAAVTGALALAVGFSAARISTGCEEPDLSTLLMLRFYTIPTTGSCYEGECNAPANEHPHEPASDTVAIGVRNP
jgi:hypothetical protein